jgi:hypothetical protein
MEPRIVAHSTRDLHPAMRDVNAGDVPNLRGRHKTLNFTSSMSQRPDFLNGRGSG